MKTPSSFVPQSSLDKGEVLVQFFELQSALADRISRSTQFDLAKIRVVFPFNDHAKNSLFSAYCILLAHERRHLWQAEQIRLVLAKSG